MQAIQGFYDNGMLKLDRKAPSNKARVIVVFEVAEAETKMSADEAMRAFRKQEGKVKGMEALAMLEKYRGRITREIDIEKERDEYLSEKHGSFN